jgi:hypothetical protein
MTRLSSRSTENPAVVSRLSRPAGSALSAEVTAGAKAVLRRMAREAGGLKVLAEALGVSITQAHRYGDAAAPDLPSFAQALAATAATEATAAAEFMAELAGGRFVPGGAADAAGLSAALFSAHGEAAEFILATGAALADGRIDAADRAALESALADVQHAVGAARAALLHSRSGGGVSSSLP